MCAVVGGVVWVVVGEEKDGDGDSKEGVFRPDCLGRVRKIRFVGRVEHAVVFQLGGSAVSVHCGLISLFVACSSDSWLQMYSKQEKNCRAEIMAGSSPVAKLSQSTRRDFVPRPNAST